VELGGARGWVRARAGDRDRERREEQRQEEREGGAWGAIMQARIEMEATYKAGARGWRTWAIAGVTMVQGRRRRRWWRR